MNKRSESNEQVKGRLSRRDFLRLLFSVSWSTLLSWLLPGSVDAKEGEAWPHDQENILDHIKEQDFQRGSSLATTIFPRKIMWEMAKLREADGRWSDGEDQSDWYNHKDMFLEGLDILQEAGINHGRLIIAPYEVTEDGGLTYNWEKMDYAIEAMAKRGIDVELAVGPFNTAYDPGVRLFPLHQQMLQAEMIENGVDNVVILGSDKPVSDPNLPESSNAIRKFGTEYIARILERYGKDKRISTFYLGNEWPHTQGIEGMDGKKATLSVDQSYMIELIDQIRKAKTDKKIALNTNLRARELPNDKSGFRELLAKLNVGDIVGFDEYPERYTEFFDTYKDDVKAVRRDFPGLEIVFTELQASPWPPDEIVGQAWVKIFREYPDLVTKYYERQFPPTISSRIIDSKIKEIGIWGSEVIIILKLLGYDFPVRMFKTMADKMSSDAIIN